MCQDRANAIVLTSISVQTAFSIVTELISTVFQEESTDGFVLNCGLVIVNGMYPGSTTRGILAMAGSIAN
jgi:hypothetical protein